jgi:hypothetical protein
MTQTQVPRRSGWSGNTRTTQESGAMLGAKWWSDGDKVACIFQREFETKFGIGREFLLVSPATITVFVDEYGSTYKKQPDDGTKGQDKQLTRFAMPPLAGFDMAVQDMEANGFPGFKQGDRVLISCIGVQKATNANFSDMPEFDISVDSR